MITPIALNAEGPSSPGGTAEFKEGEAAPRRSGSEMYDSAFAHAIRPVYFMKIIFPEVVRECEKTPPA
jgi:hypothetical protein